MAFGWSCPAFPVESSPAPVEEAVSAPTEETSPAPAERASQPRLRLAPINTRFTVSGNVGYTLRHDTTGTAKSSYQSIVTSVNPRADAQSYIWQPWFAQVSGSLGLGISASSADSTAGGYTTKSKGTSITTSGNATLKLVPVSRFPFTAHFDRTDNRQNSDFGIGGTSFAYQTTNFGMDQRYRTPDGKTNYFADYNHNFSEGAYSRENKRDSLSFGMATQMFARQSLSINGSMSRNADPLSGESTQNNDLVASHSYQPGNGFAMASTANLGTTDYRLRQGSNKSSYLQLSSFGSWQSDERPLTVTGSARLSGTRNNTEAWTDSTNMNLGANYVQSKYIRMYGTVNVNDSNGVQTVTSSETVVGTYSPNTINLGGGLSYTRSSSGSLTNQTDSAGSTQSLALGLGHGLNHNTGLGGGSLASSLSQAISASVSNPGGSSTPRLQHNGTLSWSHAENTGASLLRLNASDSRNLGGERDFFQMLNLQASRTEGLSRSSSLNGNLTMQTTHQGDTAGQIISTTDSSASLNYNHRRAFDIPRLFFSSELRVSGTGLVPLLAGPSEDMSRSWSNSLSYSIGQIKASLSASVSETKNVRYSTLYFNIQRSF